MIGGKNHSLTRLEGDNERRHRRINILECLDPTVGLPTMGMRGHVQFGNVDVAEPLPTSRKLRRRRGESVCDRGGGNIVGPPQHGIGETGVPIPRRTDGRGGNSLGSRALEQGSLSLP